ncbi:H/ACA ribonucleoprotein complex subunit 2-like protein [Aplysia californica]|uniref:H/ACA ribonucleoprotein complex subunit 2 n=1 Tax=Aplysia californica TaxID=6500 RepID=A0ABM1AFV6_APLCA|nr:H/ACA ribonucleoprotein complex subunit 2-like protein [Aplysia californica]
MGKSRKSTDDETKKVENDEEQAADSSRVSWEDKIKYLSPIAQPLASKKLTRRLYKAIKKAKANNCLMKGIKEVQKGLRKGEKGIVVLAGDVSPMDIISHIPLVCEESDIPYCFTPSKRELGEAYGSKRQACMVLIKEHEDFKDEFVECKTKIGELPLPY